MIRRSRRSLASLSLSLSLGLAAGCGETGDPSREPVAGTVRIDGRPLESGLITFAPAGGGEPVVSALVSEGAFELPRDEGPAPGAHRVEVWAQSATGRKVRDPGEPGQLVDEVKSLVPDRYNVRSELTAEVKPGGDNTFEFALSAAGTRDERGGRAGRRLR